jgi:GT2 family glycosyltransferase
MFSKPSPSIKICPEGDCSIGFIYGALLFIRRDALLQCGGFDPSLFLYYEDTELCFRYLIAGWSLILVPEAKAIHMEGQSSGINYKITWLKEWHMAWSRLQIEKLYHKNYGFRGGKLCLFYCFKFLGYCLFFKKKKILRNLARFVGTYHFLRGYPSHKIDPSLIHFSSLAPIRNTLGINLQKYLTQYSWSPKQKS